jgi:hypothetical protein
MRVTNVHPDQENSLSCNPNKSFLSFDLFCGLLDYLQKMLTISQIGLLTFYLVKVGEKLTWMNSLTLYGTIFSLQLNKVFTWS